MDHYKTFDSKSKPKPSKGPQIIGLVNGWGESNCFLNSALQVLYHLNDFRIALQSYSNCPKSKSHYCLTCGLKETFETYSNRLKSEKYTPIDITKLRSELAQKFAGKNLFAINEPADSMEALCTLLSSMHEESEGRCSPPCPAHLVFWLSVEESVICKCSEVKTDNWDINTFDQHFYVNEIFEETKGTDQYGLLKVNQNDFTELMSLSNAVKFDGRLQNFIKKQWASSVAKTCPKDCDIAVSRKELRLLQTPKVFTVNLIWRDFSPKLNKIIQILSSISYSISLDSIYLYQEGTIHNLKSMIVYGRGHYICAIRLGSKRLWHIIDDEKGKQTGSGTWLDLVYYCLTNRYYPVGLFYEQSSSREFANIPPKQWIDLERKCLDYMKNVEDCQEDEDWICECGTENNPHWTFCNKCKALRPGLSGWICEVCTFLNKTGRILCKSCGGEKSSNKTNCSCNKTPCICRGLCRVCGKKYEGKCRRCFSGKFCFVCSNEISVQETKICVFCLGETDGNFCKNCQVKVQKTICSSCVDGLKVCKVCGKYSEKKAILCSFEMCKQSFELSATFNSKLKKVMKKEESKPRGKAQKWVCGLCKNELSLNDERFCSDCFDDRKKCSSCKSSFFSCGKCFTQNSKCDVCKTFYSSAGRCVNKECAKNLIESKPKSTKGKEPICQMCSKKLPSFGFCLNCKLKLKGDRCSMCDLDACTSFCEFCVQYTKNCDNCRKQTHVTYKSCLSCIK